LNSSALPHGSRKNIVALGRWAAAPRAMRLVHEQATMFLSLREQALRVREGLEFQRVAARVE
jgi:hypothetical protein